MSNDSIINFRDVATQVDAEALSALLLQNGIPSEIEKESFNPAATFSEGSLSSNYTVRIPLKHREQAEQIMADEAKRFLEEIDPEHYLFSFTDEELIDVQVKHFEWSELDVLLSRKILEDRGVELDIKQIEADGYKRIIELAEPKKGNGLWIVAGYIFAFLGGLLGLAISYAVYKAKRNLPNGEKVYEYDAETRRHAKIIFIISLVVICLMLALRYLVFIEENESPLSPNFLS